MGIELTGWEKSLGTLIIGADSLVGGDFRSPSGGDHFVAEPWTRDYETPDIYSDAVAAELRKKGGVSGCFQI